MHIDQVFTSFAAARALSAKEIAIELFDKELRHRGLSWVDCRPVPRVLWA